MRAHAIGIVCVAICILVAYAPGLVPGKSALGSHHAGDLDTIYRQARADGASFGAALDDPAPSWQWEPLDAVATEAFSNHEWPLWQPYNGFGSPLLATLDTSVFSPTKLLLYLGVTDNRTWVFMVQLLIAGMFTYAVGASWGMHPLACASFATCFNLANYFTGTRHYPQAISAALLPVAVWAGHRVATDRPGGVSTLGTVLGTLVLSGHPESSLAMICASGTYGLTLAYSSDRWHRLRTRDPRPAIRLVLAATIGVATSMVVVLPLVGIVTDTVSHVRAKPVEGLLDPRLLTSMVTFITSIVIPASEVTAWMDQSIWHAAYMGPLAAVVALAMPKKMLLPTVALGALMGLMLVTSALTPPHGLLRGLIYFESYYAVAIGTWVVAAMTHGGLNALLTRESASQSRLLIFARHSLVTFALAGTVIATLALSDFGDSPTSDLSSGTLLIWAVVPIVAIGSTIATRANITQRRVGTILTTVGATGWLIGWTISSIGAVHRPDIAMPLPIKNAMSRVDHLARVTGTDQTTLQGNSAANWNLHDLKLSGAFHTCRFLQFAALASDPPSRLPCKALSDEINVTLTGASIRGLHLAGISTVLYPPARTTAFPAPPVTASLSYADPYVAAATLDRTLPRAYLIRSARSCEQPVPDALDAIFSKEFDPFTEVFLEPGIPPGNRDLAPDLDHDWRTACPVTQLETRTDGRGIDAIPPTDFRHTRVTFDLDVDGPAWLVLLDRNAPGWTATIDGVPTPIITANALFRAVRIQPASRHVEFRYWPAGFATGLAITLTTLAGATLALIVALVRALRSGSRGDVIAVTAGLALSVAQAGTILGFAPR